MKNQKSSFPYLAILIFLLVGTPLLDYNVNNDLVLNIKVTPSVNEKKKQIANSLIKEELYSISVANLTVK